MWCGVNSEIISFAFYIFKQIFKINVNSYNLDSYWSNCMYTSAQYVFLPRNYF